MQTHTERFNLRMSPSQFELLQKLAEKTQTDKSDLLRKMMFFCSQEYVLNSMFPHMSGNVQIERN
jgi:hypothetical protein